MAILTPLGGDPFDTGFGFAGLERAHPRREPACSPRSCCGSPSSATLVADARVAEVTELIVERSRPLTTRRTVAGSIRATIRTVLSDDARLNLGEVALS